MLDDQEAQPDRFFTELAPDDRVRLGRAISFGEEQVDDVKHRGKPRCQRVDRRRIECDDLFPLPIPLLGQLRGPLLTQRGARPLQTLIDGLVVLKQPQRDFVDAEPAQRLQREHDLRFAGNRRIGADEEHPQLRVLHFVPQENRVVRGGDGWRGGARARAHARYSARSWASGSVGGNARIVVERRADALVAPQCAEHFVLRDAEQPSARVVGRALLRPRLHRAKKRRLHGVFAQLQSIHAEPARQHRHQPPELVAEVMLRERYACGRCAVCRCAVSR